MKEREREGRGGRRERDGREGEKEREGKEEEREGRERRRERKGEGEKGKRWKEREGWERRREREGREGERGEGKGREEGGWMYKALRMTKLSLLCIEYLQPGSRFCLSCASTCEGCTGPTFTDCLQCATGFVQEINDRSS